MTTRDAVFVVFEGADVVGKTEQARLLQARFAAEGIPVYGTSFPRYETPVGLALGRHLRGEIAVLETEETLERTSVPARAGEDALYFEALNCLDKMAGAAEIRARLTEGTSVVSSRWWQTSVIYGRDAGFGEAYLRGVYSSVPQADVNFLLEASAETCLARRGTQRDRYERDLAKQERIREEYHKMWTCAGGAGEGWSILLDGERTAADVHEAVWEHLRRHSKVQRLLARRAPEDAAAILARVRELLGSRTWKAIDFSEDEVDEITTLIRGGLR